MIRRIGTEHGGEKQDMVAGKPVRIYGESHRSHPKSGMRALSVKRVVNLITIQKRVETIQMKELVHQELQRR